MKSLFKPGDTKTHTFKVKSSDKASFGGQEVHPVCSTFTLAREIEWASRLFVLAMLDDGEEGIGTGLEIKHLAPALIGDILDIQATWQKQQADKIYCSIEVKCGARIIATGNTQQKIVNKERFIKNLSRLAGDGKR